MPSDNISTGLGFIIYHGLVEAALAKGIFTSRDLANKRVLVVGGLGIHGNMSLDEPTLPMAKDYFNSQGVSALDVLPEYFQEPEGGDSLTEFLQGREPYHHIIFIEGLEKAPQPLKAILHLQELLPVGGKILLLARSPKAESGRLMARAAYDLWRFTAEDIAAVFSPPRFHHLLGICDNDGCVTAHIFQRMLPGNEIPADTKLFSAPHNAYLTPTEAASLTHDYFGDYRELDKIGCAEHTDKCSLSHNYLRKYEFFLQKFKYDTFNLLELGIFNGSSLRMWRRYFPKAFIYGVDIEPRCGAYGKDGITVLIRDLSKEENLKELAALKATVIIDDASHIWSHQLKALSILFPTLPSGGVYILEDLETSLDPTFYRQYGDIPLGAYDFCARIMKVAASKLPEETLDEYSDTIWQIGQQVELAAVMQDSVVFIKK
ncbi:MAG: class I SAM-dependent methyltransferase [Selenomonadaceae bacterium]|nr:class I SAM-dependent methyltransferase [Selenomonadaceae bacterium]